MYLLICAYFCYCAAVTPEFKLLRINKCFSRLIFQSLQVTAVPFVPGRPLRVTLVDQVVPLGQLNPAGRENCLSGYQQDFKAFTGNIFIFFFVFKVHTSHYLRTKKTNPWWSSRSRRARQASVSLNRKQLVNF